MVTLFRCPGGPGRYPRGSESRLCRRGISTLWGKALAEGSQQSEVGQVGKVKALVQDSGGNASAGGGHSEARARIGNAQPGS